MKIMNVAHHFPGFFFLLKFILLLLFEITSLTENRKLSFEMFLRITS